MYMILLCSPIPFHFILFNFILILINLSSNKYQSHFQDCRIAIYVGTVMYIYLNTVLLWPLGYQLSTDYLSGVIENKSILSWTGLTNRYEFFDTLDYLYTSGLKEITIDANETIKNNILYGFELDSSKVEESKQTEMDRIMIPSGMCKVFTGNPARYINFR